jgi:hypothetical protein
MYPLAALGFCIFTFLGMLIHDPSIAICGIIFAVCWSAERIVTAVQKGVSQ